MCRDKKVEWRDKNLTPLPPLSNSFRRHWVLIVWTHYVQHPVETETANGDWLITVVIRRIVSTNWDRSCALHYIRQFQLPIMNCRKTGKERLKRWVLRRPQLKIRAGTVQIWFAGVLSFQTVDGSCGDRKARRLPIEERSTGPVSSIVLGKQVSAVSDKSVFKSRRHLEYSTDR